MFRILTGISSDVVFRKSDKHFMLTFNGIDVVFSGEEKSQQDPKVRFGGVSEVPTNVKAPPTMLFKFPVPDR